MKKTMLCLLLGPISLSSFAYGSSLVQCNDSESSDWGMPTKAISSPKKHLESQDPLELEEQALEAFDHKEFARAADFHVKSAFAGHSENMSYLVHLYRKGQLSNYAQALDAKDLEKQFNSLEFKDLLIKDLELQSKKFE